MDISTSVLVQHQARYPQNRNAGKSEEQSEDKRGNGKIQQSQSDAKEDPSKSSSPVEVKSVTELSQEERRQLAELAQRDREVRAHEAAHKAAAGQYVRGGASFDYQRGPDGKRYAIGGEVSIDVSRPSDPKEALEKAQIIQRAALAPAQPSNQDRAIAAQAAQIAAQARIEIQQQKADDSKDAPQQRQELNPTKQYAQNGPEGANEPLNLLNLIA